MGITEQVAQEILRLFCHRLDGARGTVKDGEKIWTPLPARHKLNVPALVRHFQGKHTLGVYQVHPDTETVTWICFDIDKREGEGKLPVYNRARIVMAALRDTWHIPAVLEYTGNGFHVWVFLSQPTPAQVAQTTARLWATKFLDLDGNTISVEIFPKQGTLAHTKKRRGNLVQLPLGVHLLTGERSRFFRLIEVRSTPTADKYEAVEGKAVLDFLRNVPTVALGGQVVEKAVAAHLKRKAQDVPAHTGRRGPRWVHQFIKGIKEGAPYGLRHRCGRNEGTFSLARYLYRCGLDQELVLLVCLAVNQRHDPPLSEEVVRGVVQRAIAYG